MARVQFINVANLRTARENRGLTTRAASNKISKAKDDIVLQFESEQTLPTWSSVNKLAKLYNISELLLFSKNDISRYAEIPDYRVGADSLEDDKINALTNLVISRQKWLEHQLRTNQYKKNELQGSGVSLSDPRALADFIKSKLNVDTQVFKGFGGEMGAKSALKYLIQKLEEQGIFVGKTISYHQIKVKNLRGMFVSNSYAPFIILNRKDSAAGQIFSFIHELSHLFRKTDSLSNSIDFRITGSTANKEEVFCNRVAVEFLLPEKEMSKDFYFESDLDSICAVYKVSKLTAFYRLKEFRKIKADSLEALEDKIKKETERNTRLKEAADKNKKGGDYVNSMRDSNGTLFNKYVLSSYSDNEIGPVEASNLLKFSPEDV